GIREETSSHKTWKDKASERAAIYKEKAQAKLRAAQEAREKVDMALRLLERQLEEHLNLESAQQGNNRKDLSEIERRFQLEAFIAGKQKAWESCSVENRQALQEFVDNTRCKIPAPSGVYRTGRKAARLLNLAAYGVFGVARKLLHRARLYVEAVPDVGQALR